MHAFPSHTSSQLLAQRSCEYTNFISCKHNMYLNNLSEICLFCKIEWNGYALRPPWDTLLKLWAYRSWCRYQSGSAQRMDAIFRNHWKIYKRAFASVQVETFAGWELSWWCAGPKSWGGVSSVHVHNCTCLIMFFGKHFSFASTSSVLTMAKRRIVLLVTYSTVRTMQPYNTRVRKRTLHGALSKYSETENKFHGIMIVHNSGRF